MKKLLILLLVLVTAGGLFAQELKWSGGVQAGLSLGSDENEKGEAVQPNVAGDDWDDGNHAAGQIEAAYSQENARVTLRVRSYYSNTNTYGIGVPRAVVEFDLFDKLVGLRAGRLDESLWNTQVSDWWQVTAGVGTLVEVKPIEGLSVGVVLKTDGVGVPKGTEWSKAVTTTEELFKRTAFGFSYNNASLLYLSGAFQLADGDRSTDGKLNKSSYAIYGLNINAVPNLILKTEGKFSKIGAGKDEEGKEIDIKTELAQDIGYKIIPDTFTAKLRLKETFDGGTTTLVFMPNAEYVLNSLFTAYIEVEAKIPDLDDVKVDLRIKPKLTYTIAPKAKIIGSYEVKVPNGKDPLHTVKLALTSTF
jgi:hypothetical protein